MSAADDGITRNRYYVLEEALYWLERQQSQYAVKVVQRTLNLPPTNYFSRISPEELQQYATRNFTGICRRVGGAPMRGEAVKVAMHQLFDQGVSLQEWEAYDALTLECLTEIIEQGLADKPRHREQLLAKVQHVCQLFRTTSMLSFITFQASNKKI